MKDQDFDEFYSELSNNSDDALKSAYGKFVNQCKYQYKAGRGCFYPTTKTINYSYPTQNDLDNGEDKFATLAHESGHLFDHCMGRIDGAHFSELDAINNAVKKMHSGEFSQRTARRGIFLRRVSCGGQKRCGRPQGAVQ